MRHDDTDDAGRRLVGWRWFCPAKEVRFLEGLGSFDPRTDVAASRDNSWSKIVESYADDPHWGRSDDRDILCGYFQLLFPRKDSEKANGARWPLRQSASLLPCLETPLHRSNLDPWADIAARCHREMLRWFAVRPIGLSDSWSHWNERSSCDREGGQWSSTKRGNWSSGLWKNLRPQSDSHDWQEMSSRSAREAWRVSPDISPRSFPSHLTRVGAVPIEFEARPTVDSH